MSSFNKFLFVLILASLYSCKKEGKLGSAESIIKGELILMVDENVAGIIDEQKDIFEQSYNAKINLVANTENVVLNSLLKDSVDVVVTTVTLTENQLSHFENKKIKGKVTVLGFDAIVLIGNKVGMDSIINYDDVKNLFEGKSTAIKGMVFGNSNSSDLSFLSKKFNVDVANNSKIFSLNNQGSVVEYISKNPGYVGAVSLYQYLYPSKDLSKFKADIQRLNVKILDNKTNEYHIVNTDKAFLANNLYPFRRPIYLLNYQGKNGLGMGFASFAAGNIGQLIIDKANLLPVRIPPREIKVRNKIIE